MPYAYLKKGCNLSGNSKKKGRLCNFKPEIIKLLYRLVALVSFDSYL